MALEELFADDPERFKLVFMEVDDFDSMASFYKFEYVPTVRVYSAGQLLGEYSGDYSASGVVQFVLEKMTT